MNEPGGRCLADGDTLAKAVPDCDCGAGSVGGIPESTSEAGVWIVRIDTPRCAACGREYRWLAVPT